MAVDEAVLEAVRRGSAPPTLRMFGWRPPAISFGYAQRVSREVDLDRCRALGVDTVRRPTGGRAVLHWNELTYSVVCPSDDPSLGGPVLEAYRKISDCLVNGLLYLGVDARFESRRQPSPSPRDRQVTSPCFSSTSQYEVTIQGRKLIGSAQRRIEGVLLQHGSLLMGPEHKRIVELLPHGREGLRERFERELEAQTTSLEEALGRRISFEEVAKALRAGFQEAADLPTIEAPLSPEEAEEAERLARDKYATDAWNLGDRETDTAVAR
jgi:lipoate-protein ligase A